MGPSRPRVQAMGPSRPRAQAMGLSRPQAQVMSPSQPQAHVKVITAVTVLGGVREELQRADLSCVSLMLLKQRHNSGKLFTSLHPEVKLKTTSQVSGEARDSYD